MNKRILNKKIKRQNKDRINKILEDLDYKVVKKYSRLDEKKSNITENEIPFNDNIKTEILNQFFSTIKVIKWSERNFH